MKELNSHFSYVLNKMNAKSEITLGFIGGSITQGFAATSQQHTWVYQVYQWFVKKYPNARVNYINAGIGGTTSHLGTARVQEDIIKFHPDVVFVDFCVNDDNTPHFQETFEGLIRQILKSPSSPAIFSLNNILYNTGINAEEQYLPILTHYDIPYLSIRNTLYADICNGHLAETDITADSLHPNDFGHQLIAKNIIGILEELENRSFPVSLHNTVPSPLTENAFESAKRLNTYTHDPFVTIRENGFVKDLDKPSCYTDFFKKGWIGSKVGDAIEFELSCRCLAIQYRKTINRPTPVARVTLNNNETTSIILDGNFDENWGDCLYLQTILEEKEKGTHLVRVEIIQTHENDQVPFYLLSLIYS